MAYIRNTSNPEGLYIFSTGYMTEIHKENDFIGKIPTFLFEKLIDKYIDFKGDEAMVHNFSNGYNLKILEVLNVDEVNIKTFKNNFPKMRLSYHDMSDKILFYVDMWEVTWEFIARLNYGHSKSEWKKRRLKRICKI